jgi:hypothetical protein
MAFLSARPPFAQRQLDMRALSIQIASLGSTLGVSRTAAERHGNRCFHPALLMRGWHAKLAEARGCHKLRLQSHIHSEVIGMSVLPQACSRLGSHANYQMDHGLAGPPPPRSWHEGIRWLGFASSQPKMRLQRLRAFFSDSSLHLVSIYGRELSP